MPKAMEESLRKKAKKMGLTGDRLNAYVYGTMQKVTGWKPGEKGGKRKQVLEKMLKKD